MRAYAASVALADQILPKELCTNPLPLLAAVIGVLSTSEASPILPDESKQQVTGAIRFMAERLAALTHIVDPSAPAVNTAQLLPTGVQRKAPARTFL